MAVATVQRSVFEAKCRDWDIDPWATEFAVELAFFGDGVRARAGGLFVWKDRIEHISYDASATLLASAESEQRVTIALRMVSVFAEIPIRDRHRSSVQNVDRIFSIRAEGERHTVLLVDHGNRFGAVVRDLLKKTSAFAPSRKSSAPPPPSRWMPVSINRLLHCAYDWEMVRGTQGLDRELREEIRSFGPAAADAVTDGLIRAVRSEFKYLEALAEVVEVFVSAHPAAARSSLLRALQSSGPRELLDALAAAPDPEATSVVLERIPLRSSRPELQAAVVRYLGLARDSDSRKALQAIEIAGLEESVRSELVLALHNSPLPVPAELTRS